MKTFKTTIVILLSISALGLNSAFARQPHMDNALRYLREAREALQRAEANKGGHRERAIELVNQAIAQVEEGIRFAR
ncbi:MAG: hypothetical protein QOJ36_1209 [Verrucomicrobiota bacterium]